MSLRRMTNPRLLLLSLAIAALGCGGDDGGGGTTDEMDAGPDTGADARRMMLANVGENVILTTYVEFEAAAGDLQAAAAAWAASGSEADLTAAQEAWRSAMRIWQRAEMLQLGPAGVMDSVAGGQDLRDAIYSWPIVNDCRVDQEIVEQAYTDVDAFAAEPVNVRGLDALEYLLFRNDDDNACAPNSGINRDGEWAAIPVEERVERRAAYAETVATLVARDAATLRQAWDPEGGDFVGELARAGDAEVYGSSQDALNALSDALFYLDTETKDMKLAQPAGLTMCDTATCPEELESQHAQFSKAEVLGNLEGFQAVFLGGEAEDALGFDDLLVAVGAESLADDMETRTAEAIMAVEAMPEPMRDALDSDLDAVVAAHAAVKRVTDLLKSQFITVLDLELPQRAEGDND